MRIDIPLLYRLLTFPPLNALGVLLASVGALVTAYVAQYFFDVLPCTLCYWQRVPYALAAVLSAAALVVWVRKGSGVPSNLPGALSCERTAINKDRHSGETFSSPSAEGERKFNPESVLILKRKSDSGSSRLAFGDPLVRNDGFWGSIRALCGNLCSQMDGMPSRSRIEHSKLDGAAPIRLLLALCAAAFVVNAGIAFFHSGVELKWWAGTDTCGVNPDVFKDIASAREMLLKTPAVRCDEINFTFLGFTMANWNILAGLGLGLFAALGARGK